MFINVQDVIGRQQERHFPVNGDVGTVNSTNKLSLHC
jgi:hypothetical protein